MDAYVAGAENLVDDRARAGLRTGATYRMPGSPWRVVWHTMEAPEDDPGTPADEGWSLAQARSYIVAHPWPPHLWALPAHDWVGQTVPLDLSAYALRHDRDDPETNHRHAIQIEVIGFARDGLDDPDLCDWLGRRVLAPILAAGVPVNVHHVAPSTGPDGYGLSGAVRMTWEQWRAFDGQCGHANVPGNSHWDPGVADYARIARATTEEDDMPLSDDDIKRLWDHRIAPDVGMARSALRDARQISRRAEVAAAKSFAAGAAERAALLEAIGQLAGGTTVIDYDRIEAISVRASEAAVRAVFADAATPD